MTQNSKGPGLARRFGCGLTIAVLVLLLLALVSVKPYTEYLWFEQDAGYVRVFLLQYQVQSVLFAVGLFVTWGWIKFGVGQALGFKFVYSEVPEGPLKNLTGMLALVQMYGGQVLRFVAPLCGVIAGFSLAGEWQTALLASHARAFGRLDPIFGRDYGFFVFQLPWLEVLIGWLTFIVVLVGLVHAAVTFGLRAIQRTVPVETNAGQIQRRATLFGGLALTFLGIWLVVNCLGNETNPGRQFVGPGYAGVLQVKAQFFCAAVVILVGLVTAVSRKFALAWRGAVFALAVQILGVGVIPEVVERIHVEPDRNRVEAPFASRAIAATRYAFDLESIDVREMPSEDEPTGEELAAARGTLNNMRLWDPQVLQAAIEQLQSFKPYYAFNDVDVDRYWLTEGDGRKHEKMVMVAPRDIRTSALGEAARNWVNTRLVYTHGYGVVVAPVNTANSLGQPDPIARDLPMQTVPDLVDSQPQIYFSDFRGAQGGAESYAVVNTRVNEFDYPTQSGDAFHRWGGTTGIRVDSMFNRIAFSIALSDGNLLVTDNLKEGSRLLLHRGIVDRAALQYPFLRFDRDPYMVLVDGKQVWVLDGYTTTDRIPYSADLMFGDQPVNYVRNSVKLTVDAYTGRMTAYATRPDDPILQAYEDIYPGLIHPQGEIPEGIRQHFRYPEDLFAAQTMALCTYHVTDPVLFLSNGDSWSLPTERSLSGDQREESQPYYIEMRLPDEASDEFLLMRGFTPLQRDNLSGWLAGHCDGDKYGKLTLYLFPKGATVPGPWQVENLFVQDQRVAEVNRQFNNDQSRIIVGNLLVVPIGHSILYAESLFLQGNSERGIPELRRVVLGVKNRIEIADTYANALAQLFQSAPAPMSPSTLNTPRPGNKQAPTFTGSVDKTKLKAVAKLLDDADAALRKGDFSTYGALQKKARADLDRLLAGQ